MSDYRTGMDVLAQERLDMLDGARVGLVCHPASMNAGGIHSAHLLRDLLGERLVCLMGPEHGFHGVGAPGEEIASEVHPVWGIPIFSLYGDVEQSLAQIVQLVDVLIFDLQDLAVRCYTYVHTLRQILETADRHALRVVVTDRAVPHAMSVDGPMLKPAFQSVVAPVPAPLVYGMTPGETARWLKRELTLTCPVDVVPASHYRRRADPASLWPTWTPPSPAIRSWDCAMCFPVTVFTEALPMLDCARSTEMAFRVLCADGLSGEALTEHLSDCAVPGVSFEAAKHPITPGLSGVSIEVTDPASFRPAYAAVALLYAVQQVMGADGLWNDPRTNTRWFDRLMGTDVVREQLQQGMTPERITADWTPGLMTYRLQRKSALLYGD